MFRNRNWKNTGGQTTFSKNFDGESTWLNKKIIQAKSTPAKTTASTVLGAFSNIAGGFARQGRADNIRDTADQLRGTIYDDVQNMETNVSKFNASKARGLSFGGLGSDKNITDNYRSTVRDAIDKKEKQAEKLEDQAHHQRLVGGLQIAFAPLSAFLSTIFGPDLLSIATSADDLYNSEEVKIPSINGQEEILNNTKEEDDDIGKETKKKTISGGV